MSLKHSEDWTDFSTYMQENFHHLQIIQDIL